MLIKSGWFFLSIQRLSEDSNAAVAAAASAAIVELRKQWELEDGDSLTFTVNQQNHQKKISDGNNSQIMNLNEEED